MARLNQQILGNDRGINAGRHAPMVDLTKSGQQGLAPTLAGYNGNAAHIKRNIIPVMLEAPRGFQYLSNPEVWVSTLKNIVELHVQTIEGLNSTLTAEFAETAIGGSTEMQEDVVNVTRARSVPVLSIPEKYGKPVQTLFEGWIRNLLMDEETKIPRVMELASGEKPTDLLPDMISMSMLFFEPDATHTKVVNAWLCVNMMPKSGGDNVGKRDLSSPGEVTTLSIEFTAITQIGQHVLDMAQKVLDSMSLTGANPNHREAVIREISADVAAVENGFAKSVADLSKG